MTPPATVWTQLSATQTSYIEGVPAAVLVDGFVLLDIVIPIENGQAFADATASWTELTAPASSHTELTVAASTYVELTL